MLDCIFVAFMVDSSAEADRIALDRPQVISIAYGITGFKLLPLDEQEAKKGAIPGAFFGGCNVLSTSFNA